MLEYIDFQNIPKVDECKQIWRDGVRSLEQMFSDHIALMNKEFESKIGYYKEVQAKIETNHSYVEQYYIDVKKQLRARYEEIMAERQLWEDEKALIRSKVAYDSDVVNINVGGTMHLQTEKDVLQSVQGSTLQKLFSDMHELKIIDDEVFLDRDGKTFEALVNYLRNDRKVFPEF